MKNKFFLAIIIIFFFTNVHAQLQVPDDFQKLLEQTKAKFIEPTNQNYKAVSNLKSDLLKTDFSIKSKKKDLEIRFYLKVEKENDPLNNVPHLICFNKANTLATNSEDAMMAYHQMSEDDLKKYNADWGATFFFQPKGKVSDKKHCKMIALYAEEKGTAMILYLFNKASEEIDLQEYCFSFQ